MDYKIIEWESTTPTANVTIEAMIYNYCCKAAATTATSTTVLRAPTTKDYDYDDCIISRSTTSATVIAMSVTASTAVYNFTATDNYETIQPQPMASLVDDNEESSSFPSSL